MTPVSTCLSCGASPLVVFLSLGETPLANRLLSRDELLQPEGRYPLDVAFCPECSLVQIIETVSPEKLFRDYVYFSSFSDTMVRHAQDFATRLMNERKLGSASLVLEIASNDGYLLQNFIKAGVPALGIEPAQNIASVARDQGVPTLAEFFGLELAQRLLAEGQCADVIIANNVMAHVPDINGVMAGIKTLLKPEGIFVMETPYLRDLIDKLEFDTIYHEHVFYYSLTALEAAFRRHGLITVDVEHLSIHGGSLRVTAAHSGQQSPSTAVEALITAEKAWGAARLESYTGFAERVQGLRRRLRALLEKHKKEGKRIAAYGASAKGSTLLNYCVIGKETLDFVVDRSTAKQGRFTPGSHLAIYGPEKLLEIQPDLVLLLTWNFAEEILAQQAEFRRRGGQFIIPIPEPVVI